MSYYRICPHCGAHLDPGEGCDCIGSRYSQLTPENRGKFETLVDKLLKKQKAPVGAANTDEGEADTSDQTVSASHDTGF